MVRYELPYNSVYEFAQIRFRSVVVNILYIISPELDAQALQLGHFRWRQ